MKKFKLTALLLSFMILVSAIVSGCGNTRVDTKNRFFQNKKGYYIPERIECGDKVAIISTDKNSPDYFLKSYKDIEYYKNGLIKVIDKEKFTYNKNGFIKFPPYNNLVYTFNKSGNIKYHWHWYGDFGIHEWYKYDDKNRLTSIKTTTSNCQKGDKLSIVYKGNTAYGKCKKGTFKMTYDKYNNLTSLKTNFKKTSYVDLYYDIDSNQNLKVDYTYNENGYPTKICYKDLKSKGSTEYKISYQSVSKSDFLNFVNFESYEDHSTEDDSDWYLAPFEHIYFADYIHNSYPRYDYDLSDIIDWVTDDKI